MATVSIIKVVVPTLALLIVAPSVLAHFRFGRVLFAKPGSESSSSSSNKQCCFCSEEEESCRCGKKLNQAQLYKGYEERLAHVESELAAIKGGLSRQSQLLARLVRALAVKEGKAKEEGAVADASHANEGGEADVETRSESDYVELNSKISRFSALEFTTWTPEQTVAWVEKVLGNETCSGVFSDVDGHMLYGMIFEHDHGLSFADKCFFMGVDRESCVLLEQAAAELAK